MAVRYEKVGYRPMSESINEMKGMGFEATVVHM